MTAELNHVAEKVLKIFLDVKNVSPDYYKEKKVRLTECKNIYEALEYSIHLKGEKRERFAKEIDVSMEDLEATYRVLRNI
jgi:hypothetical protein